MRNISDHATDKNESTRRNFIWKGLLALSAGLLGKKALAAEDAPKNPSLQMEGDVMHTSTGIAVPSR